MLERCEVTDLFVDQCGHCRGSKTPEEEQVEEDLEFIKNIHKWVP